MLEPVTASGRSWPSATSSRPCRRGQHKLGRWSAQLALSLSPLNFSYNAAYQCMRPMFDQPKGKFDWERRASPVSRITLTLCMYSNSGSSLLPFQNLISYPAVGRLKIREGPGCSRKVASCPLPPCACHETRWACSAAHAQELPNMLQASGFDKECKGQYVFGVGGPQ